MDVLAKHNDQTSPCVIASFMDCEATSFAGYCTEVGFAQVWRGCPPDRSAANVRPHADGENIFIRSHSKLVRVDRWLDDHLKWDPAAEKITGISQSLVRAEGRPALEVATWLNDEFSKTTVFSDATRHDKGWIDQVFKISGLRRRFRIAYVDGIARRPDINKTTYNEQCLQQFDKLHGRLKPHRAEADALLWADLFVSCLCPVGSQKWSFGKFLGF
jgi:hypothetical protein